MALLKALASALGGFREISASDQIACDAGAMTVTPTGGTQQSVPAAIAARVLGDASGRVPPSRSGLTDLQNLFLNPNFQQGLTEDWEISGSSAVTLSNASTANLPAGAPSLNAARIVRTTAATWIQNQANNGIGSVRGTPCLGGEQFYFEAMVYANVAASISLLPIGYPTSGAPIGGALTTRPVPAAAWTLVSATIAMPPGVAGGTLRINNATDNSTIWLTNARFQRRNGAELLRDASVIPAHFYAPTRGQFFRALENSGAGRVATVTAAVPSDQGDATNIAFNHTTFVTQAGALAQFVKTALGLTDAQLAAIITAARSVAE